MRIFEQNKQREEMINELVAAYLQGNKRLVIPGLGAFIRKDGSGEVVFVEFLKKDDGILAGLLEGQYGLSRAEAGEAIAQYAENVRQHIARGGRFVVGGVGALHAGSNSLLELDYDPSADDRIPESPYPVSERGRNTSERNAPEAVQDTEVSRPSAVVPGGAAAESSRPQEAVKSVPKANDRTGNSKAGNVGDGTTRNRPAATAAPVGLSARKDTERRSSARPAVAGKRKKRADVIMIVAILAALMALGVMVYSMFAQTNPEVNLLEVVMPVQDTVPAGK